MGKPSVLDILDRMVTIAKARILQFLKTFEDPAATFDMAYGNFEQTIQMLKRGLILMQAYTYQLDGYEEKVQDSIKDCKTKVKNAIRRRDQGDTAADAVAKIWSANLVYFQNESGKATEYKEILLARIRVIEEELVKADAVKEAVQMRGELAKIRLTVASAQVKYYKEITGLKEGGVSLFEALKSLETAGEKQEATAKAMSDLVKQGFLPTIAEQTLGPVDETEVDKVMKQIEEEIKKVKSEEIEEPLTMETVPLPVKKKKKEENRNED